MMRISIERTVSTAVAPSPRVMQTALMFGLGTDQDRAMCIVPRTEIPIPGRSEGGGIVFITGPSGGGKTTVLRLIGSQLRAMTGQGQMIARVVDFDELAALAELPLVDALGHAGRWAEADPDAQSFCGPVHEEAALERITAALSCAGLGDAFVMLRTPGELSDGQRYRARLAQAMLMCPQGEDGASVIIADEFAATLDRVTAWTIARNIRRYITKSRNTLVCATTHDDLLEALEPDVLVYKGLEADIRVCERAARVEGAGPGQESPAVKTTHRAGRKRSKRAGTQGSAS